ncbi:MAG: hypothetical protein F4107_08560 [Gemmatimonadetes bacterium]|nr:hypothetical protein [Gemmatimonadota bacterium]MYD13973.1 hypothetical protein [Gemmatimonadota bacterium]MYI65968.1 hypothetical protein [Gemmatimonadota bacterium]
MVRNVARRCWIHVLGVLLALLPARLGARLLAWHLRRMIPNISDGLANLGAAVRGAGTSALRTGEALRAFSIAYAASDATDVEQPGTEGKP